MRAVYPFWTYESQRIPWIARTVVTHPGVGTTIGKYMNYTDTGYIQVPGTDMQINPLRGLVFMGGFRRFFLQDYPEYYDRFPFFSETFDALSRGGFYPGAHVTIAQVLVGAKYGRRGLEWGEVLPPFVKTGLNALAEISPAARKLKNTLIPERFRDYQTMLMVAKYTDQQNLDYSASEIYAKILDGIKLEPDEQRLWDRAAQEVDRYNMIFEQTGVFRLRPPEMVEAFKQSALAIQDLTGFTPQQQERFRNWSNVTGHRMSDYVMLDPMQQETLQELESIKHWSRLVTPLLPSEWQKEDVRITNYWSDVDKISVQSRETGFSDTEGKQTHLSLKQLEEQWQSGIISSDRYQTLAGETMNKASQQVEALHNSAYYKDVPITLEERAAHAQERGRPVPTYHPMQELIWQYYEIHPELIQDPELGPIYDWNTYFTKVDLLLDSMDPDSKKRFTDYIMRDWTNVQKVHWVVNKQFFRGYNNLRESVIRQYSPEEQAILRRYSLSDKETQKKLQEELMADGQTKLISDFNGSLSRAREHMRMLDPELDSWLFFWGNTSTLLTPEAEADYADLRIKYRPNIK